MRRITKHIPNLGLIIFLLIFSADYYYNQSFSINGNVSTIDGVPVYNALITFIEEIDTTKKNSAVTDTSGNYQIDIITAIKEEPIIPQTIELAQNYPNPFVNETMITYKLNQPLNVDIKIYDLLGQEVKTFRMGLKANGIHGIMWDGRNNLGNRVSPGIYFYQLQTGNESQVKKMIFGIKGIVVNIKTLIKNSSNSELKKGNKTRLNRNTYRVQIKNTNSTRPKISFEEYSNIVIQHDTTMNFTVQMEIMEYSLCYQRIDSLPRLNWDIYLNNLSGTNIKNITKWKHDDYNPEWSPDGKYIAFWRENPEWDSDLYLYDTYNDSLIGLLTSDSILTSSPKWTPDSKNIFYVYHIIPHPEEIHIINVDGTNDRKLHARPEFFYPDSYTFLYTIDYKIYCSNLDNTFNEFLLDLKTIGKNYVKMHDFNSTKNEILILADPTERITNLLVVYNTTAKKVDTISTADPGWLYLRPIYSHNYKKIAIEEKNYIDSVNLTNRISILDLESHIKSTIIEFPHKDSTGKYQFLHFNGKEYSTDDKYITYVKDIIQPGIMVGWISYLYVVDLVTKNALLIDNGNQDFIVQWNPLKPH